MGLCYKHSVTRPQTKKEQRLRNVSAKRKEKKILTRVAKSKISTGKKNPPAAHAMAPPDKGADAGARCSLPLSPKRCSAPRSKKKKRLICRRDSAQRVLFTPN